MSSFLGSVLRSDRSKSPTGVGQRCHHGTMADRSEAPPVAGYESGLDATLRATQAALELAERAQSVVLVEGISDQIAISALAEREGRALADEGVVIVPMGGAQAIKHFVPRFVDRPGVRLSGLCDRAEAGFFVRALIEHGVLPGTGGEADLERVGFFVCDPDLESELIRAFEPRDLEALLEDEGDLGAFRTLQKQAGWRDRPFAEQMHRWVRSVSRRNLRYARLLSLAPARDHIPEPLLALTRHA